jgi:acyl-homoserine-lactone acylase
MAKFITFIEAGLPLDNDDLTDVFSLMSEWDYRTNKDSKQADLTMLTLQQLLDFRLRQQAPDLLVDLSHAKDYLMQHFDRIDPPYGDMNRMRRGNQEWGIDWGRLYRTRRRHRQMA